MATLHMDKDIGTCTLDAATIDKVMTRTSRGNYALGVLNASNGFIPKYVGRSDTDLRAELHTHVSSHYTHFKAAYASSRRDAFEKECRNYHDFRRQLDNLNHPAMPKGVLYRCPVPDCGE